MTIEHKNITDEERHEPKGASTASAGQVYVSDGAGSGTWVRPTGWETKLDGTYTSSSELSISSGVRTKVTIDGTALSLSQGLSVWDTVNNKFVPEGDNYCYQVRFDFKASAVSAGLIELEFDAGGTVFLARTLSLSKGGSVVNSLVSDQGFFTGPLVTSAGGFSFYITPSMNIDAWGFGIFITRSHYPY